MESKEASVTYDPSKVGAEAIGRAISEADRQSASVGDDTIPDAGRLLGEEQRGSDS